MTMDFKGFCRPHWIRSIGRPMSLPTGTPINEEFCVEDVIDEFRRNGVDSDLSFNVDDKMPEAAAPNRHCPLRDINLSAYNMRQINYDDHRAIHSSLPLFKFRERHQRCTTETSHLFRIPFKDAMDTDNFRFSDVTMKTSLQIPTMMELSDVHEAREETARRRTRVGQCVFCRNNGESRVNYESHVVKDRHGRVTCPVLRNYTCPICSANGDQAHTIRYCPVNKHRDRDRAAAVAASSSASSKNDNILINKKRNRLH